VVLSALSCSRRFAGWYEFIVCVVKEQMALNRPVSPMLTYRILERPTSCTTYCHSANVTTAASVVLDVRTLSLLLLSIIRGYDRQVLRIGILIVFFQVKSLTRAVHENKQGFV